jgi:uncharacterized HAD superfamily protein
MSHSQTIAVDIDDVLSATVEGLVAFSNQRWNMQLKPEDYTEELAVFWGVSLDEALKRVEQMLVSGLVSRHRHFEDAVPVLNKLKARYELVAVTSRRSVLKPETDEWLERHFGGLFAAVHYAGIWDGPYEVEAALKRTKAELCRELGADYLIDDQLKHCEGAAAAGLQALLFGHYHWNRKEALPAGIVRVRNWDEVGAYFDKRA